MPRREETDLIRGRARLDDGTVVRLTAPLLLSFIISHQLESKDWETVTCSWRTVDAGRGIGRQELGDSGKGRRKR